MATTNTNPRHYLRPSSRDDSVNSTVPSSREDSVNSAVSTTDSTGSISLDHLWEAIEQARASKVSGSTGSELRAEKKAFVRLLKAQISQLADTIEFNERHHQQSAKHLLAAADNCKLNVDEGDCKHVLTEEAEEIICSSLRLRNFANEMKASLTSVATVADEVLGGSRCTSMLQQITSEAPWTEPNSTMVVVLSDIYEVFRSAENPANSDTKWEAPSSFERATTKYWVSKERMGDLLYTCVKEVPILVYGNSGRLTNMEAIGAFENDKLWNDLTTKISSVYFDSPNMSLYKERIARQEGAQLLRVRWYGDKPKGDEKVFLELKTHHEKWINSTSVKERVIIKEKHMALFLTRQPWGHQHALPIVSKANPKLKSAELDKAVDLLLRMHQLVLEKDLRPCVRSVYLRAAFQLPTSNALRLTLDRDVTMIDERTAPLGCWCLPDDTLINSLMTRSIPYPVFEIKLSGSDMPGSLASLIANGVILEASKFSKFLSGAAAFNSERVNTLPYWAANPTFREMFHGSSQGPGTPNSKTPKGLQQQRNTKSAATPSTVVSNDGVLSTKNTAEKPIPVSLKNRLSSLFGRSTTHDIAPKRPARVEPKSFFANERTYIQWSSAALWLLTVAALIVEREEGDEEGGPTYLTTTGIVMCIGAIIMVIHAIVVYFKRIKLMKQGNPNGYVDYCGPIILTCVVFTGVLVLLVQKTKMAGFNTTPKTNAVYQEQGLCFQHQNNGISTLGYQPSDVMVDQDRNMLLIPSLGRIMGHSTVNLAAQVKTLISIPGADMEGLTMVGDRIFALSEANGALDASSTLFEMAWGNEGQLQVVQQFDLGVSDSNNEGITYIPAQDGGAGSLYIDRGGGRLDLFDLPSPNNIVGQQLTPQDGLNKKMISNGLRDGKIAALFHFNGILYVLHDNDRVVRSWEVATGRFVSEFSLPRLSEGSAFDQQWEGMALEYNIGTFEPLSGREGSLRGTPPSLILHLALDSPPQIWSFAVEEGETNGELVFPKCSGIKG